MTGCDRPHVLVTRDARACERSATNLRQRGFEPVVLPLFKIEDTGAFFHTPKRADVLFTSANAPLTLAGRGWKARNDCTAWCVGSRTAEAAAALGFSAVHTANGGGLALRDLVTRHASHIDGKLLYGAAEIRSYDLKGTLEDDGFQVEQTELYRTVECNPGKSELREALEQADYALHFSAAGAKRLVERANACGLQSRLAQVIAICISANVAELLAKPDWAAITIASHPCEDAMLDLIDGHPFAKP